MAIYQATVDLVTLEDRVTLLEEYLSAGPITDSNNFILKIDDGSLTMYYKEGNYHVI